MTQATVNSTMVMALEKALKDVVLPKDNTKAKGKAKTDKKAKKEARLAKKSLNEFKLIEDEAVIAIAIYRDYAEIPVGEKLTTAQIDEIKSVWARVSKVRDLMTDWEDPKTKTVMSSEDCEFLLEFFEDFTGTRCMSEKPVDKSHFVKESWKAFNRKWFNTLLHKGTHKVLKGTFSDIKFENGIAVIDSSKATDIVAGRVNNESSLCWVQTADDELYRICHKEGRQMVTMNFGDQPSDPEKKIAMQNGIFETLYRGLKDTNTGKLFLPVWQNASQTRTADLVFVEAVVTDDNRSPEELFEANVKPLWMKGVGMDWKSIQESFMDEKDGKLMFNPTKMNARFGTNGSDTFSIKDISPEWDNVIKDWNIARYADPEGRSTRPNKHIVDGVLVTDDSGHDIVIGDGQSILSFQGIADMNAAIRNVSDEDAKRFKALELIITSKTCAKVHVKDDHLYLNAGEKLSKEDIINVSEALYDNKEFRRLVSKMSMAFQTRRESAVEKGAMFGIFTISMPTDETGKFFDIAIPDSFVKAVGSEWKDGSLMVCNYLHHKKQMGNLSAQFINSLMCKNPNSLNPVVSYWSDMINKATENTEEGVRTAMALYGVIGDNGDDDESILPAAIRADYHLLDDPYIMSLASKQVDKLWHEMMSGKLRVPGTYTFQACDMMNVLNMAFGLDNPVLSSGKAYFNGNDCRVATLRSPLTAPTQAVVEECTSDSIYWYAKDLFIDNAYDGDWDRRAGSDYDGDSIFVIAEINMLGNVPVGKIIVEGIKDFGYDICEPKASAEKIEWSWKNWCLAMSTKIKRDKTGEITNNNSKCWEVANHLNGLCFFAERRGLNKITFYLPSDNKVNRRLPVYDENGNRQEPDKFTTEWAVGPTLVNGELLCPGIKAQAKNVATKKFEFVDSELDVVGTFSLDEIRDKAKLWFNIGELTCAYQGIEIDGAKSGKYAEDFGYGESCQVAFITAQMIARKEMMGREVTASDYHNTFTSCSMLGRINAKAVELYNKFVAEKRSNSQRYNGYLYTLLTAEERAELNKSIKMSNGQTVTLLEFVKSRKNRYNQLVHEAINARVDGDTTKMSLSIIKDREVNGSDGSDGYDAEFGLISLVKFGFSIKAIAAACYIAAYDKTGSMNTGLAYGWLFWEELCEIFSRGNASTQLIRVGNAAVTVNVRNEVLYVNDIPKRQIKAQNGECEVISMNGCRYAQIKMKVTNIVDVDNVEVTNISAGTSYTVSLTGMKYNIKGCENPVQQAMNILNASGGVFEVKLSESRHLGCFVNGSMIATVNTVGSHELIGHTFRIVNTVDNPIKVNAASLSNVVVITVK